ncbi:MAG: hypothetical protein ACI909_001747, partial [Planctomycetota bacterium]
NHCLTGFPPKTCGNDGPYSRQKHAGMTDLIPAKNMRE